MYKHILIATDGSEIAHRAISHGIELAKKTGAKLSAVTVTEPYEALMEIEAPVMMLQADYDKRCAAFALKIISVATSAAEAVGMKCNAIHQQNRWPYKGIIKAAEKVSADLVVIGSHGRTGIQGLILGSQTSKLLTHAKVPTLVIR